MEQLRRLASEQRTSIAQIVRQAVDAYTFGATARTKNELWERAGLVLGGYASGEACISQDHDRYLDEAYDS